MRHSISTASITFWGAASTSPVELDDNLEEDPVSFSILPLLLPFILEDWCSVSFNDAPLPSSEILELPLDRITSEAVVFPVLSPNDCFCSWELLMVSLMTTKCSILLFSTTSLNIHIYEFIQNKLNIFYQYAYCYLFISCYFLFFLNNKKHTLTPTLIHHLG